MTALLEIMSVPEIAMILRIYILSAKLTYQYVRITALANNIIMHTSLHG